MHIGGQAVMEGVMLKSEKKVAVAVRLLKTKKIKVKAQKVKQVPTVFKIPFIRGIYVLIDSLIIGLDALIWSSNQNLDNEEKIKKSEFVLTLLISLLIGLGIFLGIPYLVTRFLLHLGIWFSL